MSIANVLAAPRGVDAPLDLDAEQRAVVQLPPSATGVVVGAPGSGKTATLIARAAALVEGGVDPDAVLTLTPSRQTATALRDRLGLAVGRATSGAPARSLASFAYQLVRAGAVAAGAEPPQLLTGGDEDQIIQDLLDGDREDDATGVSRWPEWLGSGIRSTRGFRAELRAFLAECTTLGIEPARLHRMAAEHDLPVWASVAAFHREYLQVRADMRGAHRDAAGLVREAVGILRTASPGAEALEGLRVILVDDAQELTLGAVELLESCAERGIAVLAFGDPDVGSGAFRGATPANFARLAAGLRTTHVLRGHHRGTAWQRETVGRVTQRIGAGGVVAHRARAAAVEPDASVRALLTRSAAEEYDVIARALRERHVHDGIAWSSCAVIAHDSRQVTALETELAAREVPTRSTGPGRALGTLAPVRDLLRLVELAARDDWSFDDVSDALGGTYGRLDPIELRRLRSELRHLALREAFEAARPARDAAAAAAEQLPLFGAEITEPVECEIVPTGRELLLSAMRRPLEFDLVDTREARRGAALARTLAALRDELERGATAHELLWTAWERSRLERVWVESARGHGPVAEQAGRDLDAVVAVFQAAKRFAERSLDADPRAFVRSVLDSDVAEDRLDAPAGGDAVRILTPAGALGTEFDTVIVAGVQDGVWPNTRLRGGLLETWRLADAAASAPAPATTLDRRRAAMHDELRLLARALSRATSRVVVTAVDDDGTGPSVFFELLPEAERGSVEHPLSLRGLVAGYRRALTDAGARARSTGSAAGQLALLADAGVAGAAPRDWYGVSGPSSLGPLRDLEREDVRVSPSRLHALQECELNWVIGDLGGDSGGTTAGIGTIIHSALETADGIAEESLWSAVEARWAELDFEAPWRNRAEKTRARDLVRRLHLYLRDFEDAGGTLIGAEPHFEVPVPLGDDAAFEHGAILSGYIDRVELTPEGSVVIVDLKTGKREPQTDAKVADNPQLGAYQLAFESGAIPAVVGRPSGGAKLLVLRPTSTRAAYVTPWQRPFDEDSRAAFVERIRAAVEVMRGRVFTAPYEEHCRDEYSYGLCRIHTVGAVSAS